jgi:SpoVK/Ycf46/Vps4 family AAA+-type ATPase
MGDAVEVLRVQTDEQNVRTAEAFARSVSKQQEGMRALTQGWVGAYRDFFFPFSYVQVGMRTFQRATQQGLEATQQTEEILRRTEEVTSKAELEAAVFGALKTTDYEELTVDDIVKKLDGRSVQQLEQVREYEKQNKDRETLIEQLERKIRVKTSNSRPFEGDTEGWGIYAPALFLCLTILVSRPSEVPRTSLPRTRVNSVPKQTST